MASNSTPSFESNSFVRRQLVQPGWMYSSTAGLSFVELLILVSPGPWALLTTILTTMRNAVSSTGPALATRLRRPRAAAPALFERTLPRLPGDRSSLQPCLIVPLAPFGNEWTRRVPTEGAIAEHEAREQTRGPIQGTAGGRSPRPHVGGSAGSRPSATIPDPRLSQFVIFGFSLWSIAIAIDWEYATIPTPHHRRGRTRGPSRPRRGAARARRGCKYPA